MSSEGLVRCAEFADRVGYLRDEMLAGHTVEVSSNTYEFQVVSSLNERNIDQETSNEAVLRPFLGCEDCETFDRQVNESDRGGLVGRCGHENSGGKRVGCAGNPSAASQRGSE